MKTNEPKVSIGLPVYNAENFIEQALDSILAQTFRDFELIISDNSSIDNTQKICKVYAKKDKRIRYYRNKKNLGAAPNFNLVFHLSKGKYFKWAAHDDIIAPTFLEECVKVLDKDKSIVLCFPKARIIDVNGKYLEDYNFKFSDVMSSKPQKRFHNIIAGHRCYEVFGLMRSDILRNTPLMGNYSYGDNILLARLILLGKFYEIPKYSFFPRKHPDQSARMMYDRRAWTVWFDSKKQGKITFPHWRMVYEFFASVSKAPITLHEKVYCYVHLKRRIKVHWKKMLIELVRIA